MDKIIFVNKGEENAVPINADNLNAIQNNAEASINEVQENINTVSTNLETLTSNVLTFEVIGTIDDEDE